MRKVTRNDYKQISFIDEIILYYQLLCSLRTEQTRDQNICDIILFSGENELKQKPIMAPFSALEIYT